MYCLSLVAPFVVGLKTETSFAVHRVLEDYAVVYMGASIFKITRLLVVAVSSVHVFACLFYKVHDPTRISTNARPTVLSLLWDVVP